MTYAEIKALAEECRAAAEWLPAVLWNADEAAHGNTAKDLLTRAGNALHALSGLDGNAAEPVVVVPSGQELQALLATRVDAPSVKVALTDAAGNPIAEPFNGG